MRVRVRVLSYVLPLLASVSAVSLTAVASYASLLATVLSVNVPPYDNTNGVYFGPRYFGASYFGKGYFG